MPGDAAQGAGWDLPTRLFHWSLVLLVVFSFTTGRLGGSWMSWHLKSGYAVLALVVFRLAWGIAGAPRSRFTRFVRGPAALLAHARSLVDGSYRHAPGHTPLGGWMVLALLTALALQAGTGLFSNDENATEGPLAVKVSNATVDRMSMIHGYGQWLLVTLVTVHVAAVVAYQWRLRVDVIGPMTIGSASDAATLARALAFIAAAAALVYWLVVVFPRP